MKFVIYNEKSENYVLPVCESCLDKTHISYGDDHRLGEEGRRDCKTTEKVNEINYQCACNPDWERFYDFIENGVDMVFDSEERAKEGLEAMTLES